MMDATQALNNENELAESAAMPQVVISLEVILYMALALLSLILRVAQLDAVPLTAGEAHQALAAWRVVFAEAAGTPIVANSPLLFTLHSLAFTVLGASEFSARILTALAGVGLILTPLLFRRLLGRTRTLLLTVLLTFSPVMLVTSRADSPVVWTLLAMAFGLWAFWRYWESGERRFGLGATVMFAAMIFLTDPTGTFLALVLVGAGVFALWTRRHEEADSDSDPQPEQSLRSVLVSWPWLTGLALSLLLVFLMGTQLMTYWAGLSTVGELLSEGLHGLVTPRPVIPGLFPILIALFYEPVIVVLGIGAIWWLIREDKFSTLERFFTGWFIFAVIFSVVYAGTGPEHSLWLVVPLAGLVSRLAVDLLTRATDTVWWSAPRWSKWLVTISIIGLLSMFSIHFQNLARSLVFSADSPIQIGSSNSISVVWVIIIILFVIIGFFLASSIWGVGTTTQGALVGLLAFMLVSSLGSGWRVAVFSASDPVEFWNRNPTHNSVFLLRQTLTDLSRRESSGFPLIPVTILEPDDGVIAWTLRDFPKTQFIPDIAAATGQEIVLLPASFDKPNLGGAYVGARYTVTSTWDYRTIRLLDFPAWWLQRRTRTGAVPDDQVILWLRQDIYDGAPVDIKR